MYSLLKYFHVSYPFYDRIPQWSAWLGNARTALRTQSRRCFSVESDNMTQVQPRPANRVDLTSTSFSFEWSLRCKIKLLTLHTVSVSQVKDQFFCTLAPFQFKFKSLSLFWLMLPTFFHLLLVPSQTLNLSPSSLQITWEAFFSELMSEGRSYIMHWRTILSWFLSLWRWSPAEVFTALFKAGREVLRLLLRVEKSLDGPIKEVTPSYCGCHLDFFTALEIFNIVWSADRNLLTCGGSCPARGVPLYFSVPLGVLL